MRGNMASKRKAAIELILKIVSDGNTHEYRDFQAVALQTHVIADENDSAVSNALMWLKQNNPDFIQVRKGEYSLRRYDSEEEMHMQFMSFDDTVDRLTYYMKKLNQFNWRKCSDAEWKEARRKMQVLEKLNGDLDRLLEGKK